MKVTSHVIRLRKLYRDKNIDPNNVEKYTNLKLLKLETGNTDEKYSVFLKNIFTTYFCMDFSEGLVDIGSGTGEIVLISNLLGYSTYGVEIYQKESAIAEKLLQDNGYTGEKLIFTSLSDMINVKKVHYAMMLSVVEHVDNTTLIDLIYQLKQLGISKILIVVPNRYKPIDDHTGLPFIGLFNRNFSLKIIKLLGYKYLLSENQDWDVHLRSPNDIDMLIKDTGYQIRYIDDDNIFPPLNLVKKIGLLNRKFLSKDWFLNLFYIVYLNLIKYNSKNYYPYLNFILEIKHEK